ncbi:TraR/DksA family transcriptional regulator [Bradymonas sediminis]|uniref:RNA polymerase-binding protein DksA n=1 Tax=Bradymonas sediminis TaxID=1548548 RepID=A0A2Z4FNV2_9DELT|nr:TraR/DksA C4-type zinc finger protein [Bradymonas sediminis]AWV90731.1 RNA polymerase-binding protein DksA [Bradymonas sediminis]TDP62627.1 TraR/DksA family transcriptional regulator [Bradymonas sediminis]
MSKLSPEALNKIREDLQKRRDELVGESLSTQSDIREADATRGGRDSLDESSTEQGISAQIRLADRDRKLIRKIDDALERLDSEDYGECEECEEPINERRLIVRPMATLCIDCKEEQERQEARNKIRPGLIDE